MSFFGSKRWRHHGFAVTAALLLLLTTTLALAGGRIEWGSKTLKPRSDNVSWNIEIAMFLPKPPDVPSVPMKFIFQQTVRYERSILDGDKHVENKTPVEGVQPIVESVDVGFLDPRSGKIENRTKFTFKLHRDHGFECGEYKVTVRDARNDTIVGQPTTLIFGGQNEEVDRRSVVFSGEKKKEKKKTDSGDGAKDGDSEKKSETEADDPGRDKSVDTKNKLEVPPEESNPVANEEVKKKPGGCGCSIPGQHSNRSSLGWFFVATAFLVGRRFASKRKS